MDSVNILVPLNIKAKLTEKLKKRMVDGMEADLNNIELELQQIDIEEKKAAGQIPPEDIRQMQAMRAHFGQMREERLNVRAQISEQLATPKKLVLGAEIIQHQTNRVVELKIGDNIRDIHNLEVVVEDDVVVAIRG